MQDDLIARKRQPKGAKGEAWGILNPYGDLWTHKTFESETAALEYVRAWWSWNREAGGDLTRFKPIRVNVHVTAIRATPPKPDRLNGEGA